MRQCEALVNSAFKNKEAYTTACDVMNAQLQAANNARAPASLITAFVVNPLTFKTSITLLPLIMSALWNDAGVAMAACGKTAHAQQHLDAAAAVSGPSSTICTIRGCVAVGA
jgi:hypothetical protein